MAERSSASTDLKIWLQSLFTVGIIAVGGYFGVTMLAPEMADPQQDTQTEPTLVAYQAPQPGEDSQAGEATASAETAAAEPEGGQVEEGQAPAGAEATLPADAEGQPGAGQADRPASGARQTAVAQGTPMPAGERPGERAPGTGGSAADARMTAIAQGTMLPADQPAGGEGATQLQARMTAIAQGTFAPGEETSEDAAAASTPQPIATSAPEATVSTDAAAPGVESTAGGGEPAGSPLGTRLFAVTRGAGAKLYDRPDGDIVGDLVAGSALSALARSDDGLWTLVQSNDNAGWIPLDQLVLFGAESLPVLSEIESSAGQPALSRPEAGQPVRPPAASTPAAAQVTPAATAQPDVIAPVPGEFIEPVVARVISQNARLNVRAGPGAAFEILERVNPGEEFVALARTAVGDWVQIALPETETGAGWVAVDYVDLSDRIDTLPVSDLGDVGGPSTALPSPTPVDSGDATDGAPAPAEGTAAPADVGATTDAVEMARFELREGPGPEFDVVVDVDGSVEFIEFDRSDDGAWTRIGILESPGGVGWVRSEQLGQVTVEPAGGVETVSTTASASIGDQFAAGSQTSEGPDAPVVFETADFPEPVAATVIAEDARLNVRSGPGMEFDIIEKLEPGAVVAAFAQNADGEWTRVAIPDLEDGAGWVATEFVTLSGVAGTLATAEGDAVAAGLPAPALNIVSPLPTVFVPHSELESVLATVISEGAFLNVRAGPGADFRLVDQVEPGDQFVASARSALGDWVQIVLSESGGAGWVASEFVDLNAPVHVLDVAGPDASAWDFPIVAPDTTSAGRAGADAANDVAQEADGLDPPKFLPVVGARFATDAAANLGGILVFEASNGGRIYGFDLESGALWSITTGFDPAVSPDGRSVAFTRDGGESGLYVVDIDGGNERLIFSGGQRLAAPKWSPDGSWIVFSRGDDAYQCIPLGPSCIPVDELGGRPLPDDISPVTRVNYHLSVVDAQGQNYHDLAALESARAPDWNEAGIVYQSDAGLQRTADEPNATSQQIINDVLKPYFHDPDWQPNGGRIVYQGKEASHWELFSVNSDGSGVTALTRPLTALVDELPSNVAPAWSPDGDAIVFLSNRAEGGEAGDWRLWVMDADGKNQRPLPIDVPIGYTFGDEQVVSWGRRPD